MRKSLAVIASLIVLGTLVWAVGNDKAQYDGGTESQIKDKAEGVLSTSGNSNLTFTADKSVLRVPYSEINDIEYGQKAGRRVAVAIVVTPLALFSKKRKHFLTVGWKDDQGKQHVAIFEIGKSVIRVTLATLEARTGQKVEYQDDDARKSGLGG